MSLGLQGAYGASAVQEGLRNRIIDQLKQRQAEQQMQVQAQEMQLRQQQEGRIAEEHAAAMQDRRAVEGERAAMNYEKGTNVIDEATMPGRYEANNPVMGRLVKAGAATPVDERPRVDVGPLQPGDSGQALAAGFLKRATTKQAENQSAAEAKVEAARLAAETRTNDNEQRQQDRLAQIKASAAASAGNRGLQDEMTRLRISGERDKQDAAHKATTDKAESARQSTAVALDLVNRLEQHPGLNKASGIIDSWTSGFSQDATDANGLRDQLVATLTLPNLGTLKGPMSDRDVIFVKQLATRLGNPKLSDTETRKALAEAKTFLQSKSDQGGGHAAGGGGGQLSVTAPDGSVHPFATQAQADAFKKLAGIR